MPNQSALSTTMTFCSRIFVPWSFWTRGGRAQQRYPVDLLVTTSYNFHGTCCQTCPADIHRLPGISRANADTSERRKRPPLHTAICVQGQVFGRSRDTINACTRLCTVCKITMSPAGTSGSHWDFTSSQNNAMAIALTVVTQPLRTHLSRHTRASTGQTVLT